MRLRLGQGERTSFRLPREGAVVLKVRYIRGHALPGDVPVVPPINSFVVTRASSVASAILETA